MSVGFASNSSLRSARRGSALATSTSSDVGVVRADGTTIFVDALGTISVNPAPLNSLSSTTATNIATVSSVSYTNFTTLSSNTTSSIAYLSSVASTKATSSTFGVIRADNTSVIVNAGVLSAPSGINGTTSYTTAGTYTFTIPAGVTKLKVYVTGGGGGGATGSTNGGGGAGGTAIKWLTGLTPGNTLGVKVAAGNAANNTSGNPQADFSAVSSGTQTISALTGLGGFSAAASTGSNPGAGGDSSGGDLNLRGNVGGGGVRPGSGGAGQEGIGGCSFWGGGGGGGGSVNQNGKYGGGGGATTGSGGDGIVVFEW
jgi:hypothetical protein